MKKEELEKLSDEELLKHAKVLRKTKIYDSFIMGLLIGIAVFSSIRNGFGLLAFLPLIYPPFAARNLVNRKQVDALVEQRGLKFSK